LSCTVALDYKLVFISSSVAVFKQDSHNHNALVLQLMYIYHLTGTNTDQGFRII